MKSSALILSASLLLSGALLTGCGSSSKSVTPPPAISVSLTPATQTNIDQGQTLNFTATVSNDSSGKGVTWSVSGTGCIGNACGTLTNSTATAAKYNAPAAVSANMTVTVQATSAADTTKSKSAPLVVSPEPAITTTTLANGSVGAAYSATLKASGGAGAMAWSLAAGSALPAGLSLSNAGVISGTPTAAGTTQFTVKVTDASGAIEGTCSQTQQLSLTIAPPPISVSINPSAQTNIDQGQTLNFTAAVANDTNHKGVTWTISGPGNLTNITTSSVTYNAPSPVSVSTPLTVNATSIADTTKFTDAPVVVSPAPSVTTTALAGGTVNTAYNASLQAAGGSGTLSWTLNSGSSLPAGLSLSSGGVISGTPTAAGTTSFTVKVTDVSGAQEGPVSATQLLSLTIAPAPLTITTTSLAEGVEGTAYSQSVQASGGTLPYTWTVASGSALPSWLSLSTSGTLSGTPTATGTFNFSLTVTDSTKPTALSKTQSFGLTVVSTSAVCGTGHESMLKGQYAFSLRGYNLPNNSGAFLAAIGSFTADGNGHITAGMVDANSLAGGVQSGAVTATGSSYSVGADYRGCATIVTPFYTFATRFSLEPPASGSSGGGSLVEWESGSTPYIAVGKLMLQKSLPAKLPAGNWVFQQSGAWYNTTYCPPMCRTAVIGMIKANGTGNFTDGEYFSSVLGTWKKHSGLNGTYTGADSTTGRFTEATSITGSSTTVHRVDYLVSGTKFLELVSDPADTGAGHVDLVGEVELQSGSPGVSGNLVYYASGIASAGNNAQFGVITITNSTTLTIKAFTDSLGTWQPQTYTCSYSIDSYGALGIDFSGCFGYYVEIYLTGPNTGVLMALDGGVSIGRLEAQSATTLTPGQYYFGTRVDVPQYFEVTQAGVATITAGGGTGTADMTSVNSPQEADQPFAETLTVNSDGTFSTSDNAGVISGVIISNSKIVLVAEQKKEYPTLVVISSAPGN